MWVADMNFPVVPTIQETIIAHVKEPYFGYFLPRDEYFNSIIKWQTERNKVNGLKKEYIGYENGVHGCVASFVQVFSMLGDKILLHSLAYMGFKNDVEGLVRTSVYSPLKLDENGVWRMDYQDMNTKIKENDIHLDIHYSPHNPCGRVWERWEIERAMEIFEANECYVISDEIWADIVYPGHQHIPTQMINKWSREHTVAVYAPSKTFNLAGLVGSYHIIYKYLRDRVTAYSNSAQYNTQNVLSIYSLIGTYKPEGYAWTDELCQVLAENSQYAHDYIVQNVDGVKAAMPQGAYMLFLDCSEWCAKRGKTIDELLHAGYDVGIAWQDGRLFCNPCHIRMNLALPLARVQETFDRLDKYVFNA